MQVRIISLDPEDTMKVLGVQAVQSTPESLLLLDSPAMGTSGSEEGRGVGALFLHIGEPPKDHLTRKQWSGCVLMNRYGAECMSHQTSGCVHEQIRMNR